LLRPSRSIILLEPLQLATPFTAHAPLHIFAKSEPNPPAAAAASGGCGRAHHVGEYESRGSGCGWVRRGATACGAARQRRS
jgi:hypothetical protein